MKTLILDVETAPILGYVWGLWENNLGLEQIKCDWYIIAWSAKWAGESEIFYEDQRGRKNIEDDKDLLKGIWKLLHEADVIVTQNGKSFDIKKLNSRFILNGFKPYSMPKHIDVLRLAKAKFGFTSNKLEYMTHKLCTKYKKQKHKLFPGFELWKGCLSGDPRAWKEMEKYNKYDVLALEELYYILRPWDSTNQLGSLKSNPEACDCGSTNFVKNGYHHTATGKHLRVRCKDCGKTFRAPENLLDADHRKKMLRNV